MIIVKTKNGDRFINDKAVTMVEHDREKAMVNAYGDKGVFFHIEDVESIIYTNDAQPVQWKDEGSEIERLVKSLDEKKEWYNKLRDEYLKIEQERDELKERVAQSESKVANEYKKDKLTDKMYHEIDRMDIRERDENRKNYPGRRVYQKNGYAKRFIHIARKNDIETVGQLLEVGRVRFERFRNLGIGCADRISEALDKLYGIKSW